jgi:hypothetical protein
MSDSCVNFSSHLSPERDSPHATVVCHEGFVPHRSDCSLRLQPAGTQANNSQYGPQEKEFAAHLVFSLVAI